MSVSDTDVDQALALTAAAALAEYSVPHLMRVLTHAAVALETACDREQDSFPDALRGALTETWTVVRNATGRGLTDSRPGCWEAEHVAALGRPLDDDELVDRYWQTQARAEELEAARWWADDMADLDWDVGWLHADAYWEAH